MRPRLIFLLLRDAAAFDIVLLRNDAGCFILTSRAVVLATRDPAAVAAWAERNGGFGVAPGGRAFATRINVCDLSEQDARLFLNTVAMPQFFAADACEKISDASWQLVFGACGGNPAALRVASVHAAASSTDRRSGEVASVSADARWSHAAEEVVSAARRHIDRTIASCLVSPQMVSAADYRAALLCIASSPLGEASRPDLVALLPGGEVALEAMCARSMVLAAQANGGAERVYKLSTPAELLAARRMRHAEELTHKKRSFLAATF